MAKRELIYCVEDEESIRGLVAYVLRGQNFTAHTFESSAEFWPAMEANRPDLILLDVMLDQEDGLQILKKLRNDNRYKDIPIIMLTAKTSEFDVVKGLDEGADDYITKPFGVVELISRIKAVLRRVKPKTAKAAVLSSGKLTVDTASRIVTYDGEEIELTIKEYDLLVYLMGNDRLVLTREQLMNTVWGFLYEGESRTVDMHIMTLRHKLHKAGKYIKTVRGVGYRWEGKE